MKAYIHDLQPGDQRSPHNSGRVVSPTHLTSLGITTLSNPTSSQLEDLAKRRGYSHRDEITISPSTLPDYEAKIEVFFTEHLHEDEEVRFILEGAGYFDVRDKEEWVRLRMEKGDLVVLPPGIYHRFTTDESDYTKALRLFKDSPKWTPLPRNPETDNNPYRKAYLKDINQTT